MLFAEEIHEVVLDGHRLTLEEVAAAARFHARVSLSPRALEAMRRSRDAVDRLLRDGRPVYGINTGFAAPSGVRSARRMRTCCKTTSSSATRWAADPACRRKPRAP